MVGGLGGIGGSLIFWRGFFSAGFLSRRPHFSWTEPGVEVVCERQDSKETAGSDCFRLRQSSNGLRPRVAPWPLKHKAAASPTLYATRLLLELLLLWTGTFPASWCMENGRARQQRPGCDTRASQHGRHLPLAVQPIACVHRARKCSHLTPHPSFYPSPCPTTPSTKLVLGQARPRGYPNPVFSASFSLCSGGTSAKKASSSAQLPPHFVALSPSVHVVLPDQPQDARFCHV